MPDFTVWCLHCGRQGWLGRDEHGQHLSEFRCAGCGEVSEVTDANSTRFVPAKERRALHDA